MKCIFDFLKKGLRNCLDVVDDMEKLLKKHHILKAIIVEILKSIVVIVEKFQRIQRYFNDVNVINVILQKAAKILVAWFCESQLLFQAGVRAGNY